MACRREPIKNGLGCITAFLRFLNSSLDLKNIPVTRCGVLGVSENERERVDIYGFR